MMVVMKLLLVEIEVHILARLTGGGAVGERVHLMLHVLLHQADRAEVERLLGMHAMDGYLAIVVGVGMLVQLLLVFQRIQLLHILGMCHNTQLHAVLMALLLLLLLSDCLELVSVLILVILVLIVLFPTILVLAMAVYDMAIGQALGLLVILLLVVGGGGAAAGGAATAATAASAAAAAAAALGLVGGGGGGGADLQRISALDLLSAQLLAVKVVRLLALLLQLARRDGHLGAVYAHLLRQGIIFADLQWVRIKESRVKLNFYIDFHPN